MISKRVSIAPENDNYARLANYIAAAKHNTIEVDKEIDNGNRYFSHMPKLHSQSVRSLAGNRLRKLSECRLASRQLRQREEGRVASLLSVNARPDRRPVDSLRRQNHPPELKAENEKCLMKWFMGGLGGDNYHEGIAEAVDVQAMNKRTSKEKTYHLVVSFRPEDEPRLSPELYKTIEERFAQGLGYSEHQRHCGVHKNTRNMHMHIAYNMIHPERFTRREPFRDFRILARTCRELEKEFGLVVDVERKGKEKGSSQSLNPGAATVEAHTGQQSFERYVKQFHEPIMKAVTDNRDWQKFHAALTIRGIELVPHGNGLVFREMKDDHGRGGKHAVKASALDRLLSKKNLEAWFGPYVPASHEKEVAVPQIRYEAVPLHRAPERGQLYQEYQAGIEARKASLQAVKDKESATLEAIRLKWEAERRRIEKSSMAKKNRRNVISLFRKREAEEMAKARLDYQVPREAVRRDIPFTSWNGFLQHKAEGGNEIALAVLRSHKAEVAPEKEHTALQGKDWSKHGQSLEIKAKYAEKEADALLKENISAQGKKQLLAILKMQKLAEMERLQQRVEPLIDGFKSSIDRKGTVLFTLPSGGMIRDSGMELFFTANDKAAQEAASAYAQAKWGKHIKVKGNHIAFARQELKKDVPKKDVQR